MALPFPGALKHPVAVKYFYRRDATEPGRSHDEIAFEWGARSRWLPDFSGVLQFRVERLATRILLTGQYAPVFGLLGSIFDRSIGHHIAQATADDIVDRLAQNLEARWAAEQAEHTDRP